jgi:hypothetical protein
MTAGVIYLRNPRRTLILTGPPFNSERDGEYANMVVNFKGKKVICGGTTSGIIARQLGREVTTDILSPCGDLPPVSDMKGVDLITEGILTLTRVAKYLAEDKIKHLSDAASKLVDLLLNSDIIDFVVGTRINEAHQDPSLPIDLEIRRNIIKKIAGILEEKYLRKVNLMYI